MNLNGKRLLLLEGNTLAKLVIDKAHELGMYVVIANWYSVEDAPAKAFADKAYTVNIFDIPAMMQIIHDEKIDGLFTAFTDSHLHIYERLCREAGLPCFTTADLVDVMVDKALFKENCAKAGLPIIDEYNVEQIVSDPNYVSDIKYPVIIKPVDNSGARGISVCYDGSTLKAAINRALDFSASKKVIIERYLRGEYCLADFMVQNGKAYFCTSSDKPANDDDKKNVNLPGAYIFPSKNNQLIKDTLSDAVQRFVDIIGYKNGLLCFELINEEGKIYIIEAQFRFGAKFQEVFLKKEYGFDQLEMLIRHAVTGTFDGYNFKDSLKYEFKNCYVLMNILLARGKIAHILEGSKTVCFPNVDTYIPMKAVGDEIEPDGSMVQMFGKVALSATTRHELLDAMRYFQTHFRVLDENGDNMVISSLGKDYK